MGPSSELRAVTVTDSIVASRASVERTRNCMYVALSSRTSAPNVSTDAPRPWPASGWTLCQSLHLTPSEEPRIQKESPLVPLPRQCIPAWLAGKPACISGDTYSAELEPPSASLLPCRVELTKLPAARSPAARGRSSRRTTWPVCATAPGVHRRPAQRPRRPAAATPADARRKLRRLSARRGRFTSACLSLTFPSVAAYPP